MPRKNANKTGQQRTTAAGKNTGGAGTGTQTAQNRPQTPTAFELMFRTETESLRNRLMTCFTLPQYQGIAADMLADYERWSYKYRALLAEGHLAQLQRGGRPAQGAQEGPGAAGGATQGKSGDNTQSLQIQPRNRGRGAQNGSATQQQSTEGAQTSGAQTSPQPGIDQTQGTQELQQAVS